MELAGHIEYRLMDSAQSPTVIGIDVGGTFTDFYLVDDSEVRVHKTPSTSHDLSVGVLRGLRDLGHSEANLVVHGSTVATNAILEGKCAKTALVTTAGFEDVLEIGRQNRNSLYDIWVQRPAPLVPVERRFGAPERVASDGSIVKPLTLEAANAIAEQVRSSGAEAVAICCLFSFLRPEHERMLQDALGSDANGLLVYVSHEVLPEYREYERTSTTVINAAVAPILHQYLSRLSSALNANLRVIQSSGGSVTATAAMRRPAETISGGPAGGVIGAYHIARNAGFDKVICFDMGGTSTDVSLCDGGIPRTNSWSLAGLAIGTPTIDIYSVGSGGGSIARIDAGGALVVGPESTGADPGPAAYGKGNAPTVTDANLVLGRLGVDDFTVARGALDLSRARGSIQRLAAAMGTTLEEAAAGVVRVANANMARAIHIISVERGYDPRLFTLGAFGGAGPLHACQVAEVLGIPRVIVPAHPGVLSAMGMTIAEVSRDYSTTVMLSGKPLPVSKAKQFIAELIDRGKADMDAMGVPRQSLRSQANMDLRYDGQSFELSIPYDSQSPADLTDTFHEAHRARFGHIHEDRGLEIVNVRVRMEAPGAPSLHTAKPSSSRDLIRAERQAFFDGHMRTVPVLNREALGTSPIQGPAIVVQYDSTTVISPHWSAQCDDQLNMIIKRLET